MPVPKQEEKTQFWVGLLSPILIAAVLVVFFPLTMFCAWCDMHVWNWFAAPYLRLPAMPYWIALGIGLWIRLQTSSTKLVKGEETYFWRGIFGSIFLHSATLLTAFLVHKYV